MSNQPGTAGRLVFSFSSAMFTPYTIWVCWETDNLPKWGGNTSNSTGSPLGEAYLDLLSLGLVDDFRGRVAQFRVDTFEERHDQNAAGDHQGRSHPEGQRVP